MEVDARLAELKRKSGQEAKKADDRHADCMAIVLRMRAAAQAEQAASREGGM
ncbi:MAG: hypothetical protein R3D29_16515 [Nitratireductor sp.]